MKNNINKILVTFVLKFNIIMPLPLAIAAGAALAGTGLNLYNMYGASKRADKAQAEADRLSNIPIPKYSPNSRLFGFYGQAVNDVANPIGYTGAERTRFNNRLSQILATQKSNAEMLGGGGVSRAIGAIGNASTINALNDFSANDANLARNFRNSGLSRMGNTISQFQNIDNMNTQVELQRRMMKEQALGEAIRSNRDLVANGITNIGNDLLGFGLTNFLPTGGGADSAMTKNTIPKDINNPRIFGGDRMFKGNRFSNYVDSASNSGGFTFPNTQDMTYNARLGRYQ